MHMTSECILSSKTLISIIKHSFWSCKKKSHYSAKLIKQYMYKAGLHRDFSTELEADYRLNKKGSMVYLG